MLDVSFYLEIFIYIACIAIPFTALWIALMLLLDKIEVVVETDGAEDSEFMSKSFFLNGQAD